MSTTPPATLSIVLVNHNGERCLPQALAALRSATATADAECIVVDSGSTDGSWQEVAERWDLARVIRFEENIGFCAGCNRGAQEATGQWLAFVNFDSLVEPGWDTPLIEALGEEGVSVAGGVLVRPDGETIEAAGLSLAPNMATYGLAEGSRRDAIGSAPIEATAASGALMMVRREEFLRLGGFYEPIWMYGEEADLCLRVRGRVVIDPRSAASHEVGHAAGPPQSITRLYWPSRNRLINASRHLTARKLVLSVIASAAFDLLTLVQLRSWEATAAISRGWRDGLSAMGEERSARTAGQRRRASSQLVSLREAVRQHRRLGRL